ncbi:hypothetical protein TWF106_004940 [Orbilia oligospora]|uniref:C2H2-type domain-containing protein n=1 Tax=Orbilia oligospora TaxID=2813651 RepID=A0A7C8UNH5_ORBOL|nr:hypothetical protein TWF106_004940 [Orbilia oligospora]
MVGDHSSIQTLNKLGLETTELFSKIAWKFENDTSIDAYIGTLLSAEADRFGLWAVSLGLFVPGHGSLDYRVREAENIRTVIKGFLETLNESLNETLEYFSPEPGNQGPDGSLNDSAVCLSDSDSEDEWWDESGHDGALDPEMVVDSIKDPIDRLYKLSTWIRNPSTRFTSSKILSHKQIDEETGVDLLEEFNSFDFNYIESVFAQYRKSKAQDGYDGKDIIEPEEKPRSPRLSPHQVDNSISPTELSLIPRLAYANGRRRQQFSYWRRHREKLALHTTSIGDNYKRHNLASKGEHNHIHKVFNETDQIAHPLSITTATRLNIPQQMAIAINDSLSIVSVSKYATSNWSPDNEKLDFPAPPKCPEGQKFIECPYCFTLCPRSILETDAWKPCPICLVWIGDMGALQKHIALHLERFAIFSLPRDVQLTNDNETGSIDANVNWEGSRDENFDENSQWSSRAGSSLIFSDQETDITGREDFPQENGIVVPIPQGRKKKLTQEEYRAMKRISSSSHEGIKTINMNLENTEGVEFTASESEQPGLSRSKPTGESTDEELDVYAKHPQQNPAQFNSPYLKSPREFKQTLVSPTFKPVSRHPEEKDKGDDDSDNDGGDDGDEEDEEEEHLAWDSEQELGNDLEVSDYEGLSFSAEESEDSLGQQGPKDGPAQPLWPPPHQEPKRSINISNTRERDPSEIRTLRTRLSELFDEEDAEGEEHVAGTADRSEKMERERKEREERYAKARESLFGPDTSGSVPRSKFNPSPVPNPVDSLAAPSYFPPWERGYTPPTGGKPEIFTCPKCNAVFTFKTNKTRHVNSRVCEGKTSINSKRPKQEPFFPSNEPEPLPLHNEGLETVQASEKDGKRRFVARCLSPGCTYAVPRPKESMARDDLYRFHQKKEHPDWARDTPSNQRSTISGYSDEELFPYIYGRDDSEYDITYPSEPATFRRRTPTPDTNYIKIITITDLREVKHLFFYTAGTKSIHFTLPIAHQAISYLDLKQSYFIWTAKQLTESIRARATQLEEIIPSLTKAYLHETGEPKASSALLQRWTIKEVVSKVLYQGRPKLKDLLSDFMKGIPAGESCGIIAYGRGSNALRALVEQAVEKCLQDGIDITLYFCPSAHADSFITKLSWDRLSARYFYS